ncbi:MAG: ribonuclease III, partial [Smithella sp.]|nr:ribonuclease III [Smithella sp.]
MDEDRLKQLEELQKRIGYTFRNPQLLETSLTHKSYINENPRSDAADNERM